MLRHSHQGPQEGDSGLFHAGSQGSQTPMRGLKIIYGIEEQLIGVFMNVVEKIAGS